MNRALFIVLALAIGAACGGEDPFPYFFPTDAAEGSGGAADGGGTDAGAADGGETDGGATDGGETDGGELDGGVTDGGETDGGETDGGETDGGGTDGGTLCTIDEDCPDGTTCDDGACVAIAPVCTPGETRCENDVDILICLEDGSGWETAVCVEGTQCLIEDGVATCVGVACVDGERGCLDADTAFECVEEGSFRRPEECGSDERCDDGECVFAPADTCITTSVAAWDFGSVLVDNVNEHFFTVSNCGDSPATVRDITLEGSSAFFFESPPLPFELASDREIVIGFAPAIPGPAFAELFVDGDTDAPAVVRLDGEGVSGGSDGVPRLHFELTWSNGVDLDNHLLRMPGGFTSTTADCFYRNTPTTWGAVLDTDDVDGEGPENINLDEPVPGTTYRAGAQLSGLNGLVSTTATYRIYADGDLFRTIETELTAEGSFWETFEVTILPDGGLDVVVVDTITPDYPD